MCIVLYKFILAVESRDLSQGDKSSKSVYSSPKPAKDWTFCKINLSILSDLPLTRKSEKTVYFLNLQIYER